MTAEEKREYNRRWRQANPERWKAIKRRGNQKNKAKYQESSKQWLKKNPARAQVYKHRQTLRRHQTELSRTLDIDHHHRTGRVRGLLCLGCNTGLGGFQEQPERLLRAIEYLREHAQ